MKSFGNIAKDGQVRAAVSEGLTVTQAVGTDVIFNSGSTTGYAAAFDSSTGKVVIAFSDGTDGSKGKAIVGTVDPSNNSISFGSEVVFQNSEITGDQMDCVFDSNANKVVIFYTDTVNSRSGAAIVGTVSGTSISFGTKATFESGATSFISACFDSNLNKLVVFYRDEGNSNYGTAAVGTVSGTGISFGSLVVFNSANTAFLGSSFDSNAGKILVVYKDVGNSNYGNSIVGTVSGTSISFGSEVTFLSANGGFYQSIFDSSANKNVVLYDNPSDNNYGYARVGTISGTSVSYGTAAKFETGQAEYMRGVFDSNAGKVAIVYKDGSNSNRPTFVSGTVSGTDISFDTPVVLKAVEGVIYNPGVAYDSTNKRVVAAYADTTANPDNGLAQVISVGYTSATGGTIADGKAVIVNADGTVSTVSESSSSAGTVVQFESGTTSYMDSAYDTTNNKVVMVYRDNSNSNYGTAVVGTVSGTSISFGTPVVFSSRNAEHTNISFDENAGKVAVFYRDTGGTSDGKANVGTVSGTSISFGSQATLLSDPITGIESAYDSTAQKIVVAYKDNSNDHGVAKVATISGTDVTFGSATKFASAGIANQTGVGYDSTNNKTVIAFRLNSDNKGVAKVATVSGTSISFGSQVEYEAGATEKPQVVFDPVNNKMNIFYTDGNNSDYMTGVIGTVSGTSISFTSPSVIYSAAGTTTLDVVYNTKSGNMVAFIRGAGAVGLVIPITSSSSSFTVGSTTTVTTAATSTCNASYAPDQEKVVVSFSDGDDSDKGKAAVYSDGASSITTENFVGFMNGAALDGTNGEILSSCSIAGNQTSLTPGQTYFVTGTGALSTTAGSPSVKAGTAISATELIVKG